MRENRYMLVDLVGKNIVGGEMSKPELKQLIRILNCNYDTVVKRQRDGGWNIVLNDYK